MKSIGATAFKQKCLSTLNRVGPDGLLITKRGKPVAKLMPVGAESENLIGSLAGRIRIGDDLLSTGVRWDAGETGDPPCPPSTA